MKMMIQRATLYDDAGYSNIRLFTDVMEKIGNEQGLHEFCAARIDLKHFSLINQQLGREMSNIAITPSKARELKRTRLSQGWRRMKGPIRTEPPAQHTIIM